MSILYLCIFIWEKSNQVFFGIKEKQKIIRSVQWQICMKKAQSLWTGFIICKTLLSLFVCLHDITLKYIPVYWLCGRYQVYCSPNTATIPRGKADFPADNQESSDFKFNVATRITAEVFRALKRRNAGGEKFRWLFTMGR